MPMPMPMKPTIPQVLPLINAYYTQPGHWNGGALHVMLEDPNYEDADALGCYEHAMRGGWWSGDESDPLGAALALVLLAMSKTQRRKLGRMVDRSCRSCRS